MEMSLFSEMCVVLSLQRDLDEDTVTYWSACAAEGMKKISSKEHAEHIKYHQLDT